MRRFYYDMGGQVDPAMMGMDEGGMPIPSEPQGIITSEEMYNEIIQAVQSMSPEEFDAFCQENYGISGEQMLSELEAYEQGGGSAPMPQGMPMQGGPSPEEMGGSMPGMPMASMGGSFYNPNPIDPKKRKEEWITDYNNFRDISNVMKEANKDLLRGITRGEYENKYGVSPEQMYKIYGDENIKYRNKHKDYFRPIIHDFYTTNNYITGRILNPVIRGVRSLYENEDNKIKFSSGGTVPVEAEGGEMIQYPNGSFAEIVGKNHEQGGVHMNVPSGTKIYSKRLVGPDGRTMAERKEFREKHLDRLVKLAEKHPNDKIILATLRKTLKDFEQQEKQDMDYMNYMNKTN